MFQTKRKRVEDDKKPKKKKVIRLIIMYDNIKNKYLVEWDDLTRTWEESVPNNFQNSNSTYIS
jgi:hypothetical protein